VHGDIDQAYYFGSNEEKLKTANIISDAGKIPLCEAKADSFVLDNVRLDMKSKSAMPRKRGSKCVKYEDKYVEKQQDEAIYKHEIAPVSAPAGLIDFDQAIDVKEFKINQTSFLIEDEGVIKTVKPG